MSNADDLIGLGILAGGVFLLASATGKAEESPQSSLNTNMLANTEDVVLTDEQGEDTDFAVSSKDESVLDPNYLLLRVRDDKGSLHTFRVNENDLTASEKRAIRDENYYLNPDTGTIEYGLIAKGVVAAKQRTKAAAEFMDTAGDILAFSNPVGMTAALTKAWLTDKTKTRPYDTSARVSPELRAKGIASVPQTSYDIPAYKQIFYPTTSYVQPEKSKTLKGKSTTTISGSSMTSERVQQIQAERVAEIQSIIDSNKTLKKSASSRTYTQVSAPSDRITDKGKTGGTSYKYTRPNTGTPRFSSTGLKLTKTTSAARSKALKSAKKSKLKGSFRSRYKSRR